MNHTNIPNNLKHLAIKHKIPLGRFDNGHFYIRGEGHMFRGVPIADLSHSPTEQSGMAMIKRYLKRNDK